MNDRETRAVRGGATSRGSLVRDVARHLSGMSRHSTVWLVGYRRNPLHQGGDRAHKRQFPAVASKLPHTCGAQSNWETAGHRYGRVLAPRLAQWQTDSSKRCDPTWSSALASPSRTPGRKPMISCIRCVRFQCGSARMNRVRATRRLRNDRAPRHDEQRRPVVGNTSGTQRVLPTTTTGGNLDEGRGTNINETLPRRGPSPRCFVKDCPPCRTVEPVARRTGSRLAAADSSCVSTESRVDGSHSAVTWRTWLPCLARSCLPPWF
jgi:hypothetical protein